MYSNICSVLIFLFIFSCNNVTSQPAVSTAAVVKENKEDKIPVSVSGILPPQGFKRIQYPSHSFEYWLENILLKKDKTVYLYDGSAKQNQTAQYAVLDISTGNQKGVSV